MICHVPSVTIKGGSLTLAISQPLTKPIAVPAASPSAIEIGADLMLKATKVNGVFTDDPMRNPRAERYTKLSFDRVLTDRLNVMDATAIVMCRDNNLPLRVFNLFNPGDLIRIVDGEDVGTLVANGL